MKKTIKILIPALALTLAIPAGALTNLGLLNLGDPVYSGGAKSLSLGLTSVSSAKNASCVFSNAAAMSAFEGSRFFFSLPIVSVSERMIPDDDWSADEGGAYYNSNFYFDIPEAAFVYAFSEKIKLGMGVAQTMDFGYKLEENIYSGGTQIFKYDYKGTGGLRAYGLAASFKLSETWAYGITREIINGNPSFEQNLVNYDIPAATIRLKSEYDFSGGRTNFSLYRDRGLWNYGISYRGKANLDYDLKSTFNAVSAKYQGTMVLPRKLTLGVNHIWAGAVSASIYFDIVKTFWSDMSFVNPATLASQNYKDRVSYHLGIENDLSSTLQIRYGMAFVPSYERSSVERAYLTAGFGYYVTSNMYVDLGYAYGRRNYIEVFRIQESLHMFNVSLDWRL